MRNQRFARFLAGRVCKYYIRIRTDWEWEDLHNGRKWRELAKRDIRLVRRVDNKRDYIPLEQDVVKWCLILCKGMLLWDLQWTDIWLTESRLRHSKCPLELKNRVLCRRPASSGLQECWRHTSRALWRNQKQEERRAQLEQRLQQKPLHHDSLLDQWS